MIIDLNFIVFYQSIKVYFYEHETIICLLSSKRPPNWWSIIYFYSLNFNNLSAFKITINAAPVSLNTAIQSVSTPGKIKTNATDFNDNREPNILFNNG